MPQIIMANITQYKINDSDVKYWLDEVISTTTVKVVIEETLDWNRKCFGKSYYTKYSVYIDCAGQWQMINFFGGSYLDKTSTIAYLMGLCHGKLCR